MVTAGVAVFRPKIAWLCMLVRLRKYSVTWRTISLISTQYRRTGWGNVALPSRDRARASTVVEVHGLSYPVNRGLAMDCHRRWIVTRSVKAVVLFENTRALRILAGGMLPHSREMSHRVAYTRTASDPNIVVPYLLAVCSLVIAIKSPYRSILDSQG